MTYQNPNTTDRLLSRKEAATYLGLAPQTLACWWTNKRYLRFPRYFVCQRVDFMLPVFPDAAL